MFDTASASNGVKLALLEGQLLSREIDRATFMPGDLEGEALDNLIRDGAMSMHHPTCTAKMGQDDLSVVDAQLRVYGVKKLRIADGSIMPTITTGNTHAPCVMIGERPPGNDDVSRLPRRRSSQ
jgi:choline dehydrogenase